MLCFFKCPLIALYKKFITMKIDCHDRIEDDVFVIYVVACGIFTHRQAVNWIIGSVSI